MSGSVLASVAFGNSINCLKQERILNQGHGTPAFPFLAVLSQPQFGVAVVVFSSYCILLGRSDSPGPGVHRPGGV